MKNPDIVRQNIVEGLNSLNRGLAIVLILEMSLLLWILPEYSKSQVPGKPAEAINVLGLEFQIEQFPVAFFVLLFVVLAMLKTISGLHAIVTGDDIEKNEMHQLLVERPTLFNLFYVPESVIGRLIAALQISVLALVLFMPTTLAVGGFIKAPVRGDPIYFLGPAAVFALPAMGFVAYHIAILSQLGVRRFLRLSILIVVVLSIMFETVLFYAYT